MKRIHGYGFGFGFGFGGGTDAESEMERQGVHGSCLRRRHGGRTETANLRTDERVAPSPEAIVPETRFQTQR